MIDNSCVFYLKDGKDITSNNTKVIVFPDYFEIGEYPNHERTIIFKMKSTQTGNKGIIEFNHIFDNKMGISYAIVNGSVVKIGDKVGDYQVLKIEEKKATFIKEGQPTEVELKKEE